MLYSSKENYTHNMSQEFAKGVPIHSQGALSGLRMGSGTLDKNGCGAVALYNTLVLLGAGRLHIASVIRELEINGGLLLSGKLGTNPLALRDFYARQYGGALKAAFHLKCSDKAAVDADACILLVINPGGIFKGMHYAAARKAPGGGGFEIYNWSGNGREPVLVKSLIGYIADKGATPAGMITVDKVK